MRTRERWGALILLADTVQFFLVQIVVAAAWTTPYSWSRNWISDLGNTDCGQFALSQSAPEYVCSPRHDLMNASFVLNGVLFLIGGLALTGLFPAGRLRTWGRWLLVVSGVLKILVGLAPENTNAGLHLLGAANVPVGAVAILLLSLALRDRPAVRRLGVVVAVISLAAAFLSTAAQASGNVAVTLGLGNGGLERVADYPAFAWMIAVALLALTANRVPARQPAPVA